MSWSDVPRVYWLAIAVTIILGLVTGSIWIAWKLFQLHVLPRIAP
jgi:hypothetical protein